MKLLGVRYVLTPHPDGSLGELRASEDRAGEPWGLIELSKPNLATYSPTSIETRRDISSMLDFVVDDSIDLSKQAVAQEQVTWSVDASSRGGAVDGRKGPSRGCRQR